MIDRNISSEVDVRYFGKGLQRHLIYILLKISSQYVVFQMAEVVVPRALFRQILKRISRLRAGPELVRTG